MPPKKQSKEKKDAETASTKSDTPVGKTNLKNFLFHIRDLCRNKGAQMDENGNIYADLIYDDLLFLKEVWMLVENGDLDIDKHLVISGTTLTNLKLDSIASLRDTDINMVCTVFKRLWTQLQRSNLKDIFDREFALFSILKDNKLKDQYPAILHSLLDYVGKVELQDHEDTDPYEYFSQELKKGKSKYFGQFYTPQSLTECCVNEVKPKMGELGLDPAAGTGKFMRTAAEYISRGNKIITEQPSLTIIEDAPPNPSTWDAYQNMRMVELEPRIYRQGILGTFIKYKKIPNMNYQRKGNSFDLLIKEKEQFDYILANPPYGGTVDGFDKIYYDTIMEQKGKRMVSKKVIKPDIVYPFDFIKKDTCVLFLQLCVNKLKKNGRAAVIFNATIMNDQHRDVLKWFLQNCNLYKMIVNPCGSFKCTGIETYSFIFTKGTPTQKIEYYELGTNKKLGELTLAQIEEREWDINPKFHDTVIRNLTYDYVTLGSLISLTKGDLQATHADGGEFPVISISEKHKHSTYSTDGKHIFIASTSSGNSSGPFQTKIYWFDGKCAVSTLMQRINILSNDKCFDKYLYYYLLFNKINIEKQCEKGTANKSLDKEKFLSLSIPLPPLPIQQEIVANLDRIFADPQDMKDCLGFTDKAMDLMLKDPTGKQLEDVLGGLRDKRDCLNLCIRKKSQMAAVVRSVGARGFERKKLGDVAILNPENISKSENIPVINYIDLGSVKEGIISNIQSFTFNDKPGRAQRKVKNNDILWGSVRPLSKSYAFIESPIENTIASTGFVVVRNNNESNNVSKYIYYMLTSDECVQYLSNHSGGSSYPAFNSDVLYEYTLPCPPLPVQHEVLAILNEMEAELQTLEQMSAKAEQRAKFILDGYLTPAPQAVEAELIVDPNSIAAFIEKHIVHEDGAEASFKDIVRKYKEWCITRPEHVLLKKSELMAALSLVLGDLANDKYKGVKLI